MPCLYGWKGFRILASGSVVFCCECVETEIGNIYEQSIYDIWHSKVYNNLRRKAFFQGCIDWQKGNINCAYVPQNKILRSVLGDIFLK